MLLLQLEKGYWSELAEAAAEGGQSPFFPVPVCGFWMSGVFCQLISCLSSVEGRMCKRGSMPSPLPSLFCEEEVGLHVWGFLQVLSFRHP